MELYILDDIYRRIQVVDNFESLIWTERFNEIGDFELLTAYSPTLKQNLSVGTHVGLSLSNRVMTVEMIEDKTDESGIHTLKFKGSSLERILKDRVARQTLTPKKDANGNDASSWKISAPPALIVRQLFYNICVAGALDPHDRIVNMQLASLDHPGHIEEPQDTISAEIKLGTLYDAMKDICDVWGLGFRMYQDPSSSTLFWDVYTGRDRSTSQSQNAPVLFSPELDNLTNVSEVNSIAASKNVAYVFGADQVVIVYPENVPPDTDGFDRRVLLVSADNISTENSDDVASALYQLGRQELAKNRGTRAFDGEVRQNSQYKYGTDYELGDLVEIRNSDGESNRMRVTEQIFVSDKNGIRSYPTLEMHQYVNTGSWLSWQSNQTWLDLADDSTTWSQLP